jgi:NDP-sugar pyrophosphorylase family protein
MKAMILAAGFGERLWPLTADRTKPALPVLGKPLVGYVAEYLARFDIRNVLVNLHHEPDSVRRALGAGQQFGVHLEYVHEPVILGTSGALDNARALLDDGTFVVINGKLITDIDLNAALAEHRQRKALATLVLRRNEKFERFSFVEVRDGLVQRFAGMPSRDSWKSDEPPLMFTGIHIIEPRLFDYIPRGVFSDSVIDVYPQAIAQGERIAGYVGAGTWYELSTLRRYLDISLALMRAQGQDVYSGANCSIDRGAEVRESILWDGVRVAAGANVFRSVIGDGVKIKTGESVKNAVVVRADLVAGRKVPAKALSGEIKGDNFVVSLSR